jgi:general secretion pathway protein H
MRMLAVGNDWALTLSRDARFVAPREGASALRRLGIAHSKRRGFTLLELLVVLTIIAIGTAGVTFAFRDSQATVLEREAERISVILETARVQSRSSGVALAWVPLPQGFVVMPVSELIALREINVNASSVNPWLSNELRAQVLAGAGSGADSASAQRNAASLLLGAEPMIAPAAVVLSLGERQLRVATDGLRPFSVQPQLSAAVRP